MSRWVAAIGITGTVLLAIGAFSLSFTSLTHLAARSGVAKGQAWEWPLIVDGVIVVATVSVVALAGRRGTGYAWMLLVSAALVSIGGNAAQAIRLPTEEPAWIAAAVATIPPIVLLAATHMTVILTRPEPANDTATSMVLPPAGSEVALLQADASLSVPEHGLTLLAAAETTGPVQHQNGPAPSVQDAGTSPGPVSSQMVTLPGLGLADVPLEDGRLGSLPSVASPFGDVSGTFRVEKARRLRASGWSTVEIAHELGVSTGSVRRYLKSSPPTDDPIGEIV